MAEKTNVPDIRFAGFTDPWEQRKLGEITERYKELVATPQDGYTRMGVRSHAKGTFLAEVEPGQQIEERELSKVRANNLVVNIVFAWEHAVAITTEKDAKALVSHRFPQFSFHDDMEPDFFRYATLDPDFKNHLWLASPSGAGRNKTLNIKTMLEYKFDIPLRSEQARIAVFFQHLDSLITLHQRKYDKLAQLKKSMLDKMFPKPGERFPEIRFAGFTDPWEQRKLGELLLFQNGFNGSSESFGSGTPLISVMDVLDDEFITHETVRGKARLNCEEASRYCVEYGDVLFQRSSENQEDAGTSNVYLDQHVSSAFGGFVIRGKKVGEYNPIFIKYLLGSSFIREQITHRAQGAQHINVSQDTLADVALLMPSMREQEAVGLVFLHLDNLITLHQRKLELLRNTKKSLLDRMFA